MYATIIVRTMTAVIDVCNDRGRPNLMSSGPTLRPRPGQQFRRLRLTIKDKPETEFSVDTLY